MEKKKFYCNHCDFTFMTNATFPFFSESGQVEVAPCPICRTVVEHVMEDEIDGEN